MRPTMQDRTGLLERIGAARRALVEMRAEANREQHRRDGMIRQAIDEGVPYRAVGQAAGMTPGGVAKVMSKPPSEPAD